MPTEKHKPLKTEVPIEATMETKIIKAIEEVKIIITKTKTQNYNKMITHRI
jgi:hypothetical protein